MKRHGGNKHRDNATAFLDSARHLHATTNHYRQVYMNAGSAVEAAIIAIGLKSRGLMTVPLAEKGGRWHNLPHLMKHVGPWASFTAATKSNRSLSVNWLVVKDWESNGRFADVQVSKKDALELLSAVGHTTNGIMQWLLNHYETI